MMTVTTTFVALVPILWSTGIGSDVMRRIAAPMVGGIVTSFIGELVVYPAVYFIWRSRGLPHHEAETNNTAPVNRESH
jgi:Cu(I)/Ag(I) efflux system membrane protein CusA/SilA